jgi:peroxiredoxin
VLENAPIFAAQPVGVGDRRQSPVESVRHALDRYHVKSPLVGRLCLSLTSLPDPQTLALVEKVEKENPDEAVQGQAAMAIAMLLSGLGEGRDIMMRRLKCLEQAIIKAEDVKVGDVTVGKIAEDELYVIRYLAKGRTAPDIIGRDVVGTPFKLSLLPSKVTVLAFWHSNMRDADRALDLLRKLHEQHGARGMQLIGVTTDPKPVLRMLSGNGTVPWRNFADSNGRITNQYRVRTLPLVYVLDQNRVIQYIGGPGSFVDLTVEALLAE